jgi:hypothetical protein
VYSSCTTVSCLDDAACGVKQIESVTRGVYSHKIRVRCVHGYSLKAVVHGLRSVAVGPVGVTALAPRRDGASDGACVKASPAFRAARRRSRGSSRERGPGRGQRTRIRSSHSRGAQRDMPTNPAFQGTHFEKPSRESLAHELPGPSLHPRALLRARKCAIRVTSWRVDVSLAPRSVARASIVGVLSPGSRRLRGATWRGASASSLARLAASVVLQAPFAAPEKCLTGLLETVKK